MTIRGYKRNYITNFIQKISFLRFALFGTSSGIFEFLYSLKYYISYMTLIYLENIFTKDINNIL